MNTVAAPTRDPMYLPQPPKPEDALVQMEGDFLQSAFGGDMKAKANWAPQRTDFGAPNGRAQWATGAMRATTVGEVMADSLDYPGGPQFAEVLALLCKVAISEQRDSYALRQAALALIRRMSETYASFNSDRSGA